MRAIALGNDPARTASLRARLRANRDTCTLFDTPRLVHALEGRYREMLAGIVPVPDLSNLGTYRDIMLDHAFGTAEQLDDAAYGALYEAKLSALHASFPIPPDNRLWLTAPAYSHAARA